MNENVITPDAERDELEQRARRMYETNAEFEGRRAQDFASEAHFVAYFVAREKGQVRFFRDPWR